MTRSELERLLMGMCRKHALATLHTVEATTLSRQSHDTYRAAVGRAIHAANERNAIRDKIVEAFEECTKKN